MPKVDLSYGVWKMMLVVSTFYSSVHLALKPTTSMKSILNLPSTEESKFHPLLIVPFHGWWSKTAPAKAPGLRFHAGDTWMQTLVSPAFAVGLPVFYLIFVLLGARFMANYNISSMKKFLKKYVQPVYNLVQIVVCAWMVWGLWPEDILRNPFSLNSLPKKEVEFFVFVH